MKYYTGVGSRSTPEDIGRLMKLVAHKLAEEGWTLRSGGAEGADSYFQRGWTECMDELAGGAEIYIPWDNFNGLSHNQWCSVICTNRYDNTKAEAIAASIHPAWDKCSRGAKALHTRNTYQVLGLTLDKPSKFLICWAPTDKHGIPTGGTRTAWTLAQRYDIPCFNLYNVEDKERIVKWLGVYANGL